MRMIQFDGIMVAQPRPPASATWHPSWLPAPHGTARPKAKPP